MAYAAGNWCIRMRIDYRISDLVPYINWAYFYHAWGVPSDSGESELRHDADRMLVRLKPYVRIRCVVQLFDCNSVGDDLRLSWRCDCPLLHTTVLPMLRQQSPGTDGYCHCISDYIRPEGSGVSDRIGLFATSVDSTKVSIENESDPYNAMLLQTLCDRLAEAAAECLHEDVRRRIWGYAPNEQLTVSDLHAERFQGIRPAVGYPCLPDLSLNFVLNQLLDFTQIGVTLTENGMMIPHASVSGMMISHPEARYFAVGKIGEDQLDEYARRRRMPKETLRRFLKC